MVSLGFKILSLGLFFFLLGCDAKMRIEPIEGSFNQATLSDLTITLVSTQPSTTNAAIPVTALFSKAVSQFSKNNISVTNGTADSVTQVSPKLYTFLVQPQLDGLVEIKVLGNVVMDSSGRGFSESNKLSFTYDQTLPTLRDLSFSPGGTSFLPTPTANFRLNKAATVSLFLGSCVSDFLISQQEAKEGDGSVENIQVTEPFTIDGYYPVMIQAQVGDKIGTCMKVGDYLLDSQRPSVSIGSTAPSLLNGPFQVIATFSESVTGLESNDIYVDGGTVSGNPTVVPGTNYTQYSFTVAPFSQGLITVRVASDSATDAAGNYNTVSDNLTRDHDSNRPTVTLSSTATEYINSSFVVKATFSESVTGLALSDINVAGGTATNLSALMGTDGKEYEFTVLPSVEGDVTVSIAIDSAFDAAQNGNSASNSLIRVHDTQSPTVSLTSTASQYVNGPFEVRAVFSEPVSGFTSAGLNLVRASASGVNGVPETYVSGYGYQEWTFMVIPNSGEEGQVSVSVLAGAASDRVGNPNSASLLAINRMYDVTRPNLISLSSSSPLLVNQPFVINLEFSEPMGTVESDNLNLVQATASAPTEVPGTNGTQWTFTITPTAQGVVSVSLITNGPKDLAGNGLLATGETVTRTFDNIRPSATLTSSASQNLNIAFSVIAEFSEMVSGFSLSDISVTKATLSNLQTLEAGKKFQFTVTPNAEGTVSLTVVDSGVEDPTGNKNTESNTLERTYDVTRPSVMLQSSASQNVNGPFTVVATFSEPMASFSSGNIAVTGGVILTGPTAINSVEWEFVVNPQVSGSVTVQVQGDQASDLAGNLNTASAVLSRTFDEVAPILSSISLNPAASPTTQTALTVNFSVNEIATLALHNDPGCNSVLSSTLLLVTGAQALTTDTLADGTYSVYIRAEDPAGNISCVLAKASHLVDTTAPELGSVNISNSSPTKSDSLSLSLFAQDATAIEMQIALSNLASPACSGPWEAFQSSKTVAIPELVKNGTVYVDVKYRDAVFNESPCFRQQIVHDNTPPATPSAVLINNGDVATNTATVDVAVTAGDSPHEVALSQNADFCTNDALPVTWLAFGGGATKSISYPLATNTLNTTTTIYARVRDQAGNISACGSDSITHSNTTPINPQISIEGGAERTNKTEVTLTLSKEDTAVGVSTQMYITNTAGCASGGTWVDFSPTYQHTLDPLNTTTSVYVKFRDKNTPAPGDPVFETACVSDFIYHDNIPPLDTGISINSGEVATPYPDIYIYLTASMQEYPWMEYSMNIYESSDCTGTSLTGGWTSYYEYFYYYVPYSKQNTQLYFSVKFRDQTGNETVCASKTILHDDKQPSISSIDKAAGPLAGGGSAVIYGSNFRSGAENSVYFGGRKATCTIGGGPVHGLYSQLTCTVPAPSPAINSAQNVVVTVTNPSTLYAEYFYYTYQEAPSISSVTSERGTGTGLTRTSEKLTLFGNFFREDVNVLIGGLQATKITRVSSTEVSFTTPAFSSVSSQTIVVTNTDDQTASFLFGFTERCTEKCGSAGGSCYEHANAVSRSCAILEDGNENSSPLYLDFVTRIPTVYINSNEKETSSEEVTLTLSASYLKATEMFITNNSGCVGGGTWEPYALSKKWYLNSGTGNRSVYVQFRNSLGETTSCVTDLIKVVGSNPDTSVATYQLRFWVEKLGSKILKASGLWADGWQYNLNASGKGHNTISGQEYLATQTNLSNLEGRTNPINVYLDDSNKFTTGKWVFYTQSLPIGSNSAIFLNREETNSPAGEAIDWLKYWNSLGTTNGADAAWFEGNIKICSEVGMRLPTLYETQLSDPGALDSSKLPVADGMPVFSSLERGVPNTSLPMWTATSNPSDIEFGEFWYVMYDSDSEDYFGAPAKFNSPVFRVRCVLP